MKAERRTPPLPVKLFKHDSSLCRKAIASSLLVAFTTGLLFPSLSLANHNPGSLSEPTQERVGISGVLLPVRRVNPRNGNLFLAYTDISIPGSGFSLEIQRVYNSRSTQVSAFGFGWSFSYGTRLVPGQGQVTIIEPDGATRLFRLERTKLYRSHLGETLEKGANGYLVGRRLRLQEHFDAEGKLIKRSDRNGNTASLHYRGGVLEGISMGDGRALRFSHDERGLIIGMTDPMGRTWRYEYDDARSLVSILTPGGFKTRFAYDRFHNLKRITYPNGTETTIDYDDQRDWVIAEVGPGAKQTRYRYSITPGSNTHHQTVITDALGRETRYDYEGNHLTIVNAAGQATKLLLCEGCPDAERMTDANGNTWHYRYDSRGNLVEAVDPGGGTWKYEYDRSGLLLSKRSPGGHVARIERDKKGNPVRFTDASGRSVRMNYNTKGDLLELISASGDRRQYRYDKMGNVIGATGPTGWKVELRRDEVGRIVEIRDPRGGQERFRFDPQDRLLAYTDPLGRDSTFTGDAAGNLTALSTRDGSRETAVYDAANRLISHSDSLGRATTYAYDAAGNVVQRTAPDGTRTTYRYDELGRLTNVFAPDDDVVLIYDPAGRIVQARNRHAHYVYTYDRAGRGTSVELRHLSRQLSYTYDADGNRTSVTLDGEEPTTFVYDTRGRLTQVRPPRSGGVKLEYDRGGRLARKTYPNGLQALYRYDALGYVASIETRDGRGAPISTIRYSSDLTGQKVVRDEVGRSRASYRYDSAGQLVGVSAADGALAFEYDSRGNRVRASGPGSGVSYTYDVANQLLKAGEEGFQFDPRGNLIRRQVGSDITQYEYGSSNRLTAVRLPGGKTVRYSYGPWGEKVKSQDTAGETSHFLYDGLNLHAKLDGNRQLKARYHSYGLDQFASMELAGQHYFYHLDHLGSVQMLTDKDGKVARRYDYEPFGMVKSRSGDDANPLLFTGRPFDQEVGLYDFRFRTFDPRLGRFLQRDPILDMNAYVYARSDPLNRLDPLGLFDIADWKNWASMGLSGAGTWMIWGEVAGTVIAGGVTVGTAGIPVLVAGVGLGLYQTYTFWNDPKDIATRVGNTITNHGGMTPQERKDLGLEPLASPSPACPAPSPSP